MVLLNCVGFILRCVSNMLSTSFISIGGDKTFNKNKIITYVKVGFIAGLLLLIYYYYY